MARAFQSNAITPLLAIVAMLMGLFAVLVTPREEEPQINVTMANVFIPFPGATAKQVETLVTFPAEQVVGQIAGIEHLYSVSQPGMAILTVQFKVGEERIASLVKLHDVLMANRDWLPAHAGVGEPIVKPKGIDDVPVLALTLHGRDAGTGVAGVTSAADLQRVSHGLETELKRVAGVRELVTLGGEEQAVLVELDAEKLAAHGLTVLGVSRALSAANRAEAAGELVQGNRVIALRAGQFIRDARDAANLIVGVSRSARAGDRPIALSEVANIRNAADAPARYVTHGERAAEFDAPAVTLAISKLPGANASVVTADVLARVAALKGTLIPDEVQVTVTRDYGQTAADKANSLIRKLIFATLSVIALVWAALGRREALVVGVAVVLTLAATLFASWAWGFTLNRVSLFALIFSIGILVDDAIVVVENIHRHRGLFPTLDARSLIPPAVDEVGAPTILATFTVIAALLPMAFVSGLMGPYMSPIPINSSLGMLLSLLIAFIVTPWLALKLGAVGQVAHGPDKLGEALSLIFAKLMRPFLDPLRGARNRLLLWLGIAGAILVSVLLAVAGLVVLKMLPFDNKSEFQVVVDMPTGTALERTQAVLTELAAELKHVPEVTHVQTYAGTSAPINFNGLVRQYYLRARPEMGDIQVNLQDKSARSRKSHDIAQGVRPALEAIAKRHGADLKVVEVPPGPPVLSPIVAEVYAGDDAERAALAKRVRAAFEATPAVVGTDDTVQDPAPQFDVRVDQARAALLGVSVSDIATTLRMALSGGDVTLVHDERSKLALPVRLRLPAREQGDIDRVLRLKVQGASGALVPIAELVRVQRVERDAPIHHKNLLPVTYVTGDVGGPASNDSPLYGLFDIRGNFAKAGVDVEQFWIRQPAQRWEAPAIKWDGELQVTYETFRDMGAAYAVGLILIYLLVVAQFKSYLTPLIIMAPIPLTVIGVMPGHAITGAQFTATSMIGMIALAGIIVRNSILLVDFIRLKQAEGVALAEATVDAAAARAKPIALTAVAAMLGALFILDDPIFNGLAVSLLFGIFVATLLTLLVIPVLYFAAHDRAV
ncbi:MAG: efflux RND transporter permease subunit [Burkholderiales bacterium]|nr:efflux RND transporter permease subunit [Burkholderiales bacterium]